MDRPFKILFVDDDSFTRKFFRDCFIPSLGFEVDSVICESLTEAKVALSSTFDVIISDYNMEEAETGLDFFHYVMSKQPERPFVLFTGEDANAYLLKASKGHPNLHLALNKDYFTLTALLVSLHATTLERQESHA
jgi:DNA-binding NtrC family response regulator